MSEEPSSVVELADTVSDLLYGVAGWILVGLGVLGLLGAGGGALRGDVAAATALLAFSTLFVVSGVFVNPRFRRRLNRRLFPTRFGRARTVDDRVLRSEEGRSERCVECGSRMSEGLVRRYREEFVVAGVPTYTFSEGFNHYCAECATDETGTAPSADDRTTGRADASSDEPLTERD